MALAGISTLGLQLSYGVETTAGTKPSAFSVLHRINSVGGITQDIETIDASALEDTSTQYIAGRADTGGSVSISVNITPDTISEWTELITSYNSAHEANKQMWFQLHSAGLGSDSFFWIGEPPQDIPMPESSQNELWVVEIPVSVVEYKGIIAQVAPTE